MKRTIALVLASLVLVSTMASGVVLAQSTPTETPTETPTNTSTHASDESNNTSTNASQSNAPEAPPGLQLSATLGAMSKEVDSAVERYALGHKLQNADSKEERKQIINNFLDKQQKELEKSDDDSATESNNTFVRGYKDAMSVVAAQNANQSVDVAQKLADKYNVSVNKTKVQMLRQHASNMTGQEVSALARSLAGPPGFANAPDHAGPPAHAGPNSDKSQNKSERGKPAHAGDNQTNTTTDEITVNESVAAEKIANAKQLLSEARNNSNVSTEALNESESYLEDSKAAFSEAQNASEEDAQSLYEEAYENAVNSIEVLQDAQDADSETNRNGNTTASGQKGNA